MKKYITKKVVFYALIILCATFLIFWVVTAPEREYYKDFPALTASPMPLSGPVQIKTPFVKESITAKQGG